MIKYHGFCSKTNLYPYPRLVNGGYDISEERKKLSVGKRKRKMRSTEAIYDTSVCHAKFRNTRVDVNRNRYFDHNRELYFDHNRVIQARLQGVVFRDHFAIGFRNMGISNIEEISNPEDWPKIDPAKGPDSLIVSRDRDYEKDWGRDMTYETKWGEPRDTTSDQVLMPTEMIEPQLSYHDQSKAKEARRSERRGTRIEPASNEFMIRGPKKRTMPKNEPAVRSPRTRYQPDRPVHEVIGTDNGPIITPPPRQKEIYSPAPQYQGSYKPSSSISTKTKKKAFAYNEYALALMESGQYKRAMNFFLKAKNLDPYEGTYTTNMNRCQQWLDHKSRKGA